jgi:hypothetical protein
MYKGITILCVCPCQWLCFRNQLRISIKFNVCVCVCVFGRRFTKMFGQICIWLRYSILRDVTQSRLAVIYRRFGTNFGPIFKVQAVSQKQTHMKTKHNFRCFRSKQSVYSLLCKRYVCPSVKTQEPLHGLSCFWIWGSLAEIVDMSQIWLNFSKNSGHFT